MIGEIGEVATSPAAAAIGFLPWRAALVREESTMPISGGNRTVPRFSGISRRDRCRPRRDPPLAR